MKSLRDVFIFFLIIHIIEIVLLVILVLPMGKNYMGIIEKIVSRAVPIDVILSILSFIFGGIVYSRNKAQEPFYNNFEENAIAKKKRGRILAISIFHLAGLITAVGGMLLLIAISCINGGWKF